MQRMLEYITSKIQLLVLYQKYIRSYDMMRKVEEQAQRDQDVLSGYFGRTFTTSALNTPAFYSCLQAGEYSGQDGAKTYRVLVQLRLAFEVFEGAGANDFCERGTACYYVDTERSTGPMVRVQLGEGQNGISVHWFSVTSPERLEVTAVEMGLDYTQETWRIELCSPGAKNVAEEFLPTMARVLKTTKQHQMQSENSRDWPCDALRPWRIRGLWEMPVMLWVTLPADKPLKTLPQGQSGSQLLPNSKRGIYESGSCQDHWDW